MIVHIIGGGLSGLATALSIKEHNEHIAVTIFEKHKKIGFNTDGRQCGEAHNIDAEWMKWKPSKKAIACSVSKGEVYVGNHQYHYESKPGTAWILNRPQFIFELAEKAKELGVQIQCNSKIHDSSFSNADIIVDASGCPSVIKKKYNFLHGLYSKSYQQTLIDSNSYFPNTLKVYFDQRIGYYWIFPRREQYQEINIGIGISQKMEANLNKLLEQFKKKHQINGTIDHVTGGIIPQGLQYPFKYKNILFVGDAAVGTFPISGQGIYRALLSGDVAGACIAKNKVNQYPHIIMKMFIKWDVIGKTFFRMNHVIRHINPYLVLSFHNFYLKYTKMIKI